MPTKTKNGVVRYISEDDIRLLANRLYSLSKCEEREYLTFQAALMNTPEIVNDTMRSWTMSLKVKEGFQSALILSGLEYAVNQYIRDNPIDNI